MMDLHNYILLILKSYPKGLLSNEVENLCRDAGYSVHHGIVSGALSSLHRAGEVYYLHKLVNRRHPYIHRMYKANYHPSEVMERPKQNKWRTIADILYRALEQENLSPKQRDDVLNLYRNSLDA